MKIDTLFQPKDLRDAADSAREFEDMGFDGLWTFEAQRDPFLPLGTAATTTKHAVLGTAIAVAFPRSPMLLANTAWDLSAYSSGRFVLGLGTQVKGHNERRFSVKWESPGKRLREVILSIRAIWDCWRNGTPLDFRGEFYQFTLMTPFFVPPPLPHPPPPIFLASLNPWVTRLAGEICDGFHVHPFHSPRFVRERILPEIDAGAAKAGRTRSAIVMSAQAFVAVGESREAVAAARERVRQQISFYASTKAYQGALEVHGWGDLASHLGKLAAQGEWQKMVGAISDEMLDAYSVSGGPDEVAAQLRERYEGSMDRISNYFPPASDAERACWRKVLSRLA